MTGHNLNAALALAAEFAAQKPSARFVGLLDVAPAAVTPASPVGRSAIITSLLGEDPVLAAARLAESGLFSPQDVAEGVRQSLLMTMARGETPPRLHELPRSADASGAMHEMLTCAVHRDFNGIVEAYDRLLPTAQMSAEVMLLAGHAFANLGRSDRGELLLDSAMIRLVEDGDLFRPSFWLAVDLVMRDDCVAQARLLTQLIALYGEGDPSVALFACKGLFETCLRSHETILSCAEALTEALKSLLRRSSGLTTEDLHYLAGALGRVATVTENQALSIDAMSLSGKLEFMLGRTVLGRDLQRQASRSKGAWRDVSRITSAPVATLEDLQTLPSVPKLHIQDEPFRPLDPMARVEGRPIVNPFGAARAWCAELNDAEIISGDAHGSIFHYVLTSEGYILMDGLNLHPSYHVGRSVDAFRALSPTGEVLLDLSDRPQPRRLGRRALLIGGVANYYHWLMEYLPRLGLAADVGMLDDEISILVNAQPAPWQSETLDALGVRPTRLEPLFGESTLKAVSLVVPSLPSTQFAVDFLRRSYLKEPVEQHRLIYVARLDCDASRSRVANEVEVAREMSRLGAEIIIPGETSFAEQVRLFSEAAVVVGPHGAGLTNIAFCAPGTRVLEIVNSVNADYSFFDRIADAAGLSFQRWTSERELPTAEPENAASVIDVSGLVKAVQALRGE